MRVHIPTPLSSYTAGAREVEVAAVDLAGALSALDAAYPGLRFRIIDEQDRIREHINLFINGRRSKEIADRPLEPGDEIHIIAALSGG